MVSASIPASAPASFGRRLEWFFLLALIVFVPLYEAPKNLFAALFALTWLINGIRARDFGGPFDRWDALGLLWVASGYVVAAFAGLEGRAWHGANDILVYGLLLLIIRRAGLSRRQLGIAVAVITASTAVALVQGAWMLYVTHSQKALELNSVGHVNHSAIYLAISAGILASALLAFWGRLALPVKLAGSTTLVLFLAGLVVGESRAAVGASGMLILVLGAAWGRRSWKPLLAMGVLLVAAIAIIVTTHAGVLEKHLEHREQGNPLTYRTQLWNGAELAWRHFPVFGVGMSNYPRITEDMMAGWLAAEGKTFSHDEYMGSSHAHSLFWTNLAERGVFGIAVLGLVLLTWLGSLIRHYPRADAPDIEWALWGGALSGWFITVVIGVVNTTLHHEHAILAILPLAMWLSLRKRPRQLQ